MFNRRSFATLKSEFSLIGLIPLYRIGLRVTVCIGIYMCGSGVKV